jgi:hypothetical protein
MSFGTQDLASAVAAVFIVGMIWLRTRMHYTGRGRMSLRLTRAGQVYFACVLMVLALGWLSAPLIGRLLWPAATAGTGIGPDPMITRVIWFLLTYYVFIVIHRALQSRHVEVFRPSESL